MKAALVVAAAFALGAAAAAVPAAQARSDCDTWICGSNGTTYQGKTPQGRAGQGGEPSGRGAEAVDLGALALRAVRLPDGQVLPAARE